MTHASPRRAVVVKLGGSVFSDKKRSDQHTDRAVMDRVVARLRRFVDEGYDVVLVSGGGSFGHGAIRCAESGTAEERHPLLALVRALELVRGHWVDALANAGIDGISLALPLQRPADAYGVQGLTDLLDAGIIPVLSGGVQLTPAGALSVLSSDRVPELVAAQPGRDWTVLVVADSPGLVDKHTGRTVPVVEGHARAAVQAMVWAAPDHDRTGGMLTKLDGLFACADAGASTALVSQEAFLADQWDAATSFLDAFAPATTFTSADDPHEETTA